MLDVIAEICVSSPTFDVVDRARLDNQEHTADDLYEGLGHAIIALTDDATVVYICNSVYNARAEHSISPLDPALGPPKSAVSKKLKGKETRIDDEVLLNISLDLRKVETGSM